MYVYETLLTPVIGDDAAAIKIGEGRASDFGYWHPP
jgi:hypothetical protein